jgi:hypothetical protein
MKTFLKSIKILHCFSLIISSILFSCALRSQTTDSVYSDSAFLKGQALVYASNFKDSIPFLKKSLENADKNYSETLMLLGRSYDQLDQPELALLSLNEYISRIKDFPSNVPFEITVRSLIFKNQLKLNADAINNYQKPVIEKLLKFNRTESNFLEKRLDWSNEFLCQTYCLQEIYYFRQSQLYLVYALEGTDTKKDYAEKQIVSIYTSLSDSISNVSDHKKKVELATALYDTLQVLKKYSLLMDSKNKNEIHAKLLLTLDPIEKKLESWTLQ